MKIEQAKDEFKKQLRLRGYSHNTIETYGSCAALFLSKFKNHNPSKSEIEDWLLSFKSEVYRKHLLVSIKNLNKWLFNNKIDCDTIPYPRHESKLPEILSPQEVQRIFNVCTNLKHRTAIALLYSAGFRVGELIDLKWKDIDRYRMVITVRQGKNKKDRQVQLDKDMLLLLEKYYREYKSKEYVFNGQSSIQYTAKSIQEFIKTYAKKAGLKKHVHPHQFRHSCLTELFNNGTDAALIQKIAGHQRQSTTMRYIHLSNINISKIQSPLSQINL